jgi:hypothetical protein
VNLTESELSSLILSALPHSPKIPFVWIYGAVAFLLVQLNSWLCRHPFKRFLIAVATATLLVILCNHFVDKESEYNAKLLAKIIVTQNFEVLSVDEGEWIEVRARNSSDKIYIGITHAEAINHVLESIGIPFLSLVEH